MLEFASPCQSLAEESSHQPAGNFLLMEAESNLRKGSAMSPGIFKMTQLPYLRLISSCKRENLQCNGFDANGYS